MSCVGSPSAQSNKSGLSKEKEIIEKYINNPASVSICSLSFEKRKQIKSIVDAEIKKIKMSIKFEHDLFFQERKEFYERLWSEEAKRISYCRLINIGWCNRNLYQDGKYIHAPSRQLKKMLYKVSSIVNFAPKKDYYRDCYL